MSTYRHISLRKKILSQLLMVLISVVMLVLGYEYVKAVRTFDYLAHKQAEDMSAMISQLAGSAPSLEVLNQDLRSVVHSTDVIRDIYILSGTPMSVFSSSMPSLVGARREDLPFLDLESVLSFKDDIDGHIWAKLGREYMHADFLRAFLPGQRPEQDPEQDIVSSDQSSPPVGQSYIVILLDASPIWQQVFFGLLGDLIAAFFVVVIFGFFAYVLLGRSVFRPLEKMSQALARRSDVDVDITIPVYDNDEIGDLGRSLNILFRDMEGAVSSLRESEERYGIAVKASNAAIWDWDIAQDEVHWAGWSHSFFGTDSVLKLPRTISDFYDRVHPEDRRALKKAFFAHIREKTDFDIEFRIKLFFGGYVWTHAKARAAFDEEGYPIRMTGSFNNITARKKAELQMARARHDTEKALDALKESEERLALALDGTTDGLWDWNVDTGEAYYSPRFRRVLGYDPDDEKGFPSQFTSFMMAIHPDDKMDADNALRDHLRDPLSPPFDTEFRLKMKDDTYRYFRARAGALRDEQGIAHRVAGSLSDVTERKLAEKEVLTYQERLSAIVDKAADGIMTINMRGEIEQYNAACEKIFGYTQEEALGQSVEILMADKHSALHAGYLSKAAGHSKGGPFEMNREVEGRRKNGEQFPLQIAVTGIEVEGTKLFAAVLRDVSARKEYEEHIKRAREEAEEANRKMNLILNSMAEGIYGVDREGRTTFVNPAAEQILGYSQKELFAHDSHDLFHHSYVDGRPYPKEECKISNSIQRKKAVYAEDEVFWRKDGESFPVSYTSKPIFDAEGAVQGAVVTFRDITERKRAEAEILAYQERLAAIVDRAADGIITIDTAGTVEQFNAACERIFGYKREEVIGRNVSLLVPEDHRMRHDSYIQDYLETGRSNIINLGRELQARRRDGTLFPIYLAVTEIEVSGKRLFTGILRDISADKEYEENLQRARIAAEEATQAKSEFLANMSHEIRTPMNGILGTASLLNETALNEKQRKYVDTIAMSGDVLMRLLNDVLDFSKIEAGKFSLTPEPFDMRKTLEDVYDLFEGNAREKGLAFTMNIDKKTPPYLVGDYTRIRQVVSNLTSNAIKYTTEGAVRIDLTVLNKKGGHVALKLAITDTGMGIPEKLKKNIFEKFTRVEGRVSKIAGTGLGLAICTSLVEMMDGEIGVDSVEGDGSTFWFTIALPQASAEEIQSKEKQASYNEEARYYGHLLLVEDVVTNQFVISDMLESMGCKVDIADNGKIALDMLRKNPDRYDVVLMDCNMPVMNGFEATEEIRDHNVFSGVPVIALTANAFKEDIERCYACGMNDFVAKPVNKADLFEALAKWLERSDEAGQPDSPAKAEKSEKKKPKPRKPAAKAKKTKKESTPVKDWTGFDPAFLDMMVERSPERAEKFIKLTLKDAKSHMSGLKKAVKVGDAAEIGENAHALKSITGQAGAHVLSDYAQQLEKLGKGGESKGADKIFDLLKAEYDLLLAKFKDYQARIKAAK